MKSIFAASLALLAVALPWQAAAQSYPTRSVRVVLPYSAGSGPDAVVRQVGEKMQKDWGQTLVVDNKPGGNGWIAIGDLKRSPADGYTLMTVDATHIALHPNLYKQLPFDATKDFEPVAGLYTTNFFIVVGANSAYKNVTDLINAAKAQKGKVTYGSWGIGSVAHLGSAMLESATGTDMLHVQYRELPMLYTSVSTGEVDWAFGTAATVGPLYKAKKVKLLAYAGAKRLAGYEDVPTVAEAGGPQGFELRTWVAMYAPKGTPAPVVAKLNADVRKALTDKETRDRLAGFGFEPWTVAPADMVKTAETDTKRYAEVVKRAAISLD